MIDALRPSGWLLLEDVDFFPVHTSTSQLYVDFMIALTANVALCRHWWREWAFGGSVAKATFPCCKEARRLPNFFAFGGAGVAVWGQHGR
jgi:hypothetical protein